MRAVELQANGYDGLKMVERPVPDPGPSEVVLRIKGATLNYRDLMTITAGGRRGVPYPVVPLSCGAGEVVALGDGVTRVVEGDRVTPSFFPDWISGPPTPGVKASVRGNPLDGCLQEYLLLPENALTKAPAHLTDLGIATLACAGVTAWRALVVEGGLQAGESVLVQGTGGVSIFGLQFAKLHGAEVVITSSSDAKLERARELGADHTINYRTTPDWARSVRDVTGGRGVDHIIDVGGQGSLAQSLQCVACNGHVSVVGILGGFEEPLPMAGIMGNNVTIHGIMVGSRDDAEAMCRAIDLHKMEPVVSDVFDFEEHTKALQLMESGGHFGKIGIQIG